MWTIKLFNDRSPEVNQGYLNQLKVNQKDQKEQDKSNKSNDWEPCGVEFCVYHPNPLDVAIVEALNELSEHSKALHTKHSAWDIYGWLSTHSDEQKRDYVKALNQSNQGLCAWINPRVQSQKAMHEELSICKRLGIKKATVHLFDLNLPEREHFAKAYEGLDPKAFAKHTFDLFVQAWQSYGVLLHVENTFDPFDWYTQYVQHLLKINQEYIACELLNELIVGITFDIGHSKALCASAHSLTDWNNWLVGLMPKNQMNNKSMNISEFVKTYPSLMFHVHGNNGLVDQHKPVSESFYEHEFEGPEAWLGTYDNALQMLLDWHQKSKEWPVIKHPLFIFEFDASLVPESLKVMQTLTDWKQ